MNNPYQIALFIPANAPPPNPAPGPLLAALWTEIRQTGVNLGATPTGEATHRGGCASISADAAARWSGAIAADALPTGTVAYLWQAGGDECLVATNAPFPAHIVGRAMWGWEASGQDSGLAPITRRGGLYAHA